MHSWEKFIEFSSKICILYDVGGDAKYIKTCLSAITNVYPHYVAIVLSAVKGLSQATKELIDLAVAMNYTIFMIVTCSDKVKECELDALMFEIKNYLNSNISDPKVPLIMRSEEDVKLLSKLFYFQKIEKEANN